MFLTVRLCVLAKYDQVTLKKTHKKQLQLSQFYNI